MSNTVAPQPVTYSTPPPDDPNLVITVISHSPLIYWWPVWAVGFVLALMTGLQGEVTQFGDVEVLIHPSPALGVIFTVVFLLVIVMTHLTVRGTASVAVIVSLIAIALFLAYMNLWDPIFQAMGRLAIFLNLGFYVFFSSAVFIVWALTVFVFDRMEYYEFRPGQGVRHTFLGGGEHTFDTRGMVVEKKRDDLFRHWILGLGSGDIHIATTGARSEEFYLRNVMFVDGKLAKVQRLAAMKPAEFTDTAVRQM